MNNNSNHTSENKRNNKANQACAVGLVQKLILHLKLKAFEFFTIRLPLGTRDVSQNFDAP